MRSLGLIVGGDVFPQGGLHLAADRSDALGRSIVTPQGQPVEIDAAVGWRVVLKECVVLLEEGVDALGPGGGLLLPVAVLVVHCGKVPQESIHQRNVGVGGQQPPFLHLSFNRAIDGCVHPL